MKADHQHNLTDEEFIRMHEHTEDPILREALRRIDGRLDDEYYAATEQAEMDSI